MWRKCWPRLKTKPSDDPDRCEPPRLRPCDLSDPASSRSRLARFTSERTDPGGVALGNVAQLCPACVEPPHFRHPESISAAWNQTEQWLTCPVVWIPQPTERHRDILGSLLSDTLARSNLVPDAHLAALAIEHGLTLCSTDRDFARFPNLRWDDPLQKQRT